MYYKTVGYQLLIDLDEKASSVKNDLGIIVASSKNSHQLRSGIVREIGSLALKEDPEIEIGDRVHFIDREMVEYRVGNEVIGIIRTDNVRLVEKAK